MRESEIAVRTAGGEYAWIVRVTGSVDLASAGAIEPVIRRAGRRPERVLVIDLSAVDFFGAVGVTLMVTAACRAHLTGTVLRLVATKRIVLQPMEAAGVLGAFAIHDSADTALRTRPAGTGRADRDRGWDPVDVPAWVGAQAVAIASQRDPADRTGSVPVTPFTGITGAYQSCVAIVLRAVRFGWLSRAESALLLDRIRVLSGELAARH
ncbi:STAS domain-containing protein [Kibdelosporangium phytohabitans]|uniref:STAS domain-containing protein n=1 Tax=Kibdelosporangium phytohabitans TaxID=860235 RepID=A0A0N9HLD2_9PSEU|nr:STAS domain-containing protein [Kibdelosporangium phytohabitans]ALG06977.1 hypothetical protein AOZ06_08610 [Kibdelosporangium phytohabitans]MBE1468261.1 anti-anti-sigma factor [Kibdelosporangium phytohabitans]